MNYYKIHFTKENDHHRLRLPRIVEANDEDEGIRKLINSQAGWTVTDIDNIEKSSQSDFLAQEVADEERAAELAKRAAWNEKLAQENRNRR